MTDGLNPILEQATDQYVARHELVERVLRELLALPAPYRDTLLQRFFEDRGPLQIAEHDGVSVATVKTRQKRGLAMLRERLDGESAAGHWRASLVGVFGLGGNATASVAMGGVTGAMVMGSGTKLSCAAAMALLAAGAFWWFGSGSKPAMPVLGAKPEALAAAADSDQRELPSQPPADVERSEALTTTPAAPTDQVAATTAASWLKRFNEAWPLDQATAIAQELAQLPGERVLAILQEIYSRIDSDDVRRLLLGPLVRRHPRLAIALWHFGAQDAAPEVRTAALAELSRYALLDFVAWPARYEAWHSSHAGQPASEALRSSLAEHLAGLRSLGGAELAAALARIDRQTMTLAQELGLDVLELLRLAGMTEVMERAVAARDPAVQIPAWQFLALVGVDDAFLQRHAPNLLQAPDELTDGVRRSVYTALSRSRGAWAGDALVAAMLATAPAIDGSYYEVATAIGARGDPAAIPLLIGMIEADNTYKTIYGVGYFGLQKLTGVPYHESHDGKWWRRWWEQNQHRLPATVRGQPIPSVRLR